jgi:hypothetical protein
MGREFWLGSIASPTPGRVLADLGLAEPEARDACASGKASTSSGASRASCGQGQAQSSVSARIERFGAWAKDPEPGCGWNVKNATYRVVS